MIMDDSIEEAAAIVACVAGLTTEMGAAGAPGQALRELHELHELHELCFSQT